MHFPSSSRAPRVGKMMKAELYVGYSFKISSARKQSGRGRVDRERGGRREDAGFEPQLPLLFLLPPSSKTVILYTLAHRESSAARRPYSRLFSVIVFWSNARTRESAAAFLMETQHGLSLIYPRHPCAPSISTPEQC